MRSGAPGCDAVEASGWRRLRTDVASGVEVAIVAEELGRGLADVPFLGPMLAAELRRLAVRAPRRAGGRVTAPSI